MGLYLQETAVNTDLNYIIGETDVYETYTDERGELFRSCQREYGRCTGRVYVDTADATAVPVGWVFTRLERYDDTGEPYHQETWVTVHTSQPTVSRVFHYAPATV